jgi:hypothetical protein
MPGSPTQVPSSRSRGAPRGSHRERHSAAETLLCGRAMGRPLTPGAVRPHWFPRTGVWVLNNAAEIAPLAFDLGRTWRLLALVSTSNSEDASRKLTSARDPNLVARAWNPPFDETRPTSRDSACRTLARGTTIVWPFSRSPSIGQFSAGQPWSITSLDNSGNFAIRPCPLSGQICYSPLNR